MPLSTVSHSKCLLQAAPFVMFPREQLELAFIHLQQILSVCNEFLSSWRDTSLCSLLVRIFSNRNFNILLHEHHSVLLRSDILVICFDRRTKRPISIIMQPLAWQNSTFLLLWNIPIFTALEVLFPFFRTTFTRHYTAIIKKQHARIYLHRDTFETPSVYV